MTTLVLMSSSIRSQLNSPVPGLPYITENNVLCVRYSDATYPEDFIFPAVRLARAVEPARVLKPGDLSHEQNRNFRPQIGELFILLRPLLTN